MLDRIESRFTPEARGRHKTLLDLIISDYLAFYGPRTRVRAKWGVWGTKKRESPRRLALLFVPRMLNNPCLHATLLLRLAIRSPRFMFGFWRTLLIAKHSFDIQRDIEIGPGLLLLHPIGIGLGATTRIGSDVTILHYVSIGGNTFVGRGYQPPGPGSQLCPTIGDDVVIYTQSILVGGITIGNRAVISAGAWVDHDVPPKTVHPGRAAMFRRLSK